jgi:Fic-DOC domain mobile mystery protein B
VAEIVEVNFRYPPGATPLSPDDLDGLIPGHIGTQGELDAWEQQNILDARQRLARRKPRELLSDDAFRRIHHYMFDQTWRWAGRYRKSNKNIGVAWELVPEQVRVLCDDARYQRDHETYPADEFGVRLHHRLVAIHPFPNGNGRHARLVTDLVMQSLGEEPFSWGNADLNGDGKARERYIQALRAADRGDYQPLLAFVRS